MNEPKCEVKECNDKDLIIICHNHIDKEYACTRCDNIKKEIVIQFLKQKEQKKSNKFPAEDWRIDGRLEILGWIIEKLEGVGK